MCLCSLPFVEGSKNKEHKSLLYLFKLLPLESMQVDRLWVRATGKEAESRARAKEKKESGRREDKMKSKKPRQERKEKKKQKGKNVRHTL